MVNVHAVTEQERKNKKKCDMKTVRIVFLVAFVLMGCRTEPQLDPVRQFRVKHPDQAKDYDVIYPIKLDTYSILLGERTAKINGIALGMKQRFGNVPGVNDYADQILRDLGNETAHSRDYFRKLKEKSSGGGAICQYQWSDGNKRETGLLVLKSGEVIERDAWITDYLREK